MPTSPLEMTHVCQMKKSGLAVLTTFLLVWAGGGPRGGWGQASQVSAPVTEITVYANGANPYPQPDRGQSKSKFLIDTTNLWERMQNNIHQYTRNEGKACKQLI